MTSHYGKPRPFEAGELVKSGLTRAQRAVRQQRGEDIAKIIKDRLSHNKGERRFVACAKSDSPFLVERDGAADEARLLAVVVGDDRLNIRGERTLLQRTVRRDDVDLVAMRAEDLQTGIHDQDAVDIGRLRGASEQLADRHYVGRGDRLRDVGALHDAFEPR